MSEWLDVIVAIVGFIHDEPRAAAVTLILGGAGTIFAVIIRKTRSDDSLSLR